VTNNGDQSEPHIAGSLARIADALEALVEVAQLRYLRPSEWPERLKEKT
jgi:hypothetical protein